MTFGRPRRPNDPSVMASVEAAISTVARPGPIAWLWHWRYELGLTVGLAVAAPSSYPLASKTTASPAVRPSS